MDKSTMHEENRISRRLIWKGRKIKLTDEDMQVKPMTSVGSIIAQASKGIPPTPTRAERPDLYHICNICGVVSSPAYTEMFKRWYMKPCPCQAEERKRREEQEMRNTWINWQITNCFGGWLGDTFKDATTAKRMAARTFEASHVQDGFMASALAYASTERPQGNLLLIGNYGSGKTYAGMAILNKRREMWNNTTICTSAPEFFRAYEAAKKERDQTSLLSITQRAIQAHIFFMDDIDKEWRGQWKQEEIQTVYYDILNARYLAKRPTIISTNEQETLERYIGAAALSRLKSLCTVLETSGDNLRAEEVW